MASEAIDAGAGAGDGARAEAPSPPSWTTLSLSMVARGGRAGRRASSGGVGCFPKCGSPNSACSRLGSAGGS